MCDDVNARILQAQSYYFVFHCHRDRDWEVYVQNWFWDSHNVLQVYYFCYSSMTNAGHGLDSRMHATRTQRPTLYTLFRVYLYIVNNRASVGNTIIIICINACPAMKGSRWVKIAKLFAHKHNNTHCAALHNRSSHRAKYNILGHNAEFAEEPSLLYKYAQPAPVTLF